MRLSSGRQKAERFVRRIDLVPRLARASALVSVQGVFPRLGNNAGVLGQANDVQNQRDPAIAHDRRAGKHLQAS